MIPSLVTIARRALEGEAKLSGGSTLLLAVSGGPDSMAMLDVVARLASKLRLRVEAHGVDHGLRPAAAAELDLAAAHAAHLGVTFERTIVEVARGGNLQARARSARYAALVARASTIGADAIATAHHADDRAETVLLRLCRGAGPRGLAVLPARAPMPQHDAHDDDDDDDDDNAHADPTVANASSAPVEILRPLLRARRSDVLAHLARHRIPYAQDPSNEDPRFLRVRVRRELLPLLEALSPQIVSHLEALADQLVDARAHKAMASPTFPLPRATERALATLATTRSKSARVWLPGGLVALVATGNGDDGDDGRPQRSRSPSASSPRARRTTT